MLFWQQAASPQGRPIGRRTRASLRCRALMCTAKLWLLIPTFREQKGHTRGSGFDFLGSTVQLPYSSSSSFRRASKYPGHHCNTTQHSMLIYCPQPNTTCFICPLCRAPLMPAGIYGSNPDIPDHMVYKSVIELSSVLYLARCCIMVYKAVPALHHSIMIQDAFRWCN